MPKIDNTTSTTFDLVPGVNFTSIASPSRGSGENAVWRAKVFAAAAGLVHHMTREEIIIAVAGRGIVTIGETSHLLQPGDAFAVPAFTDFKLECSGSDSFEAMVVLPVGGRAVIGTQPSFQPPWSI
jgi:mannose-6-phosphate isomerase-like protein (cupin superfamily)